MEEHPAQRKRSIWFRRLKRLGFWTAIVFAFCSVLALSVRAYFVHRAEKDFEAAVAELDPSERAWRWEDIEARREVIPLDENSAIPVQAAASMLPAEWPKRPANDPQQGVAEDIELPNPQALPVYERMKTIDPNRHLDAAMVTELRAELGELKESLSDARKVIDMPNGRYSFVLEKNPYDTRAPHLQRARNVATLLSLDALLRVEDKDPDGAIASVRGMLNSGRSVGDEPLVISVLVRSACDAAAITTLESVIAKSDASLQELDKLSKLLELEESTLPIELVNSFRGERAAIGTVYERMYTGDISMKEAAGDHSGYGLRERTFEWCWSRPVFYHHRAAAFRYVTRIVDLSKQSRRVRRLGVRILNDELDVKSRGGPSAKLDILLVPAITKIFEDFDRRIASLRCARVAIAAESYRRAKKSWPRTLEQLVPAYIQEVPDDPYGDGPLQLQEVEDGLFIYSVGPTGELGGQMIEPIERAHSRVEPYFRLWNPKSRGLPPVQMP